MDIITISATDIPDAWYQCIYNIMGKKEVLITSEPQFDLSERQQVLKPYAVHEYIIDRGSYEGQKRREFEFIVVKIQKPESRPLVPLMPEGSNIPPPTDMKYITETYLPKLVSADFKEKREDYTYGEFLEPQIKEVIRMYKEDGFGTNQATMTIGDKESIYLQDPPCLRQIDTRIYPDEKKLHFIVYFRSWDLWGGFPSNLAAIQLLKEYMADEIGVGYGETIAISKGLHLYEMYFDVANLRLGRS